MQEAARQAVEQGASPAPPVPSAAQLARIEAADFLADGMAASGEEDADLGLAAACFHDLPRLYHAIQKAIHTLFDDEVNDPVNGVKDPVNGMCTYALRAASAPMDADGTGGYGEPASLDRRTAVDDPRSYRLVEIPLPSRDANGPVRVASLLEGRASSGRWTCRPAWSFVSVLVRPMIFLNMLPLAPRSVSRNSVPLYPCALREVRNVPSRSSGVGASVSFSLSLSRLVLSWLRLVSSWPRRFGVNVDMLYTGLMLKGRPPRCTPSGTCTNATAIMHIVVFPSY